MVGEKQKQTKMLHKEPRKLDNHQCPPGSEKSSYLIPLMPEVLTYTNGGHMFYKTEVVFLL